MPHYPYALDSGDWIGLATIVAAWLVVLATYGLAVVTAATRSRRPF